MVASAIVGAIFCAYIFMLSKAAGIAIGTSYLALLLALTVIKSVAFKKNSYPLNKLLAFVIATVLSVSAFSTAAVYSSFRVSALEKSGEHYIVGRLCDVDVRNGNYTLVLENLSFDGKDVKGKIKVSVVDTGRNRASFLDIGDRLSFRSKVNGVPLVSAMRVDGNSFRTGVIYTCSIGSDSFEFKPGAPNGIEKFLIGLKRILVDNMGARYGNIAYSMITGDKYGLSYVVSDTFSAAGLGHVLAVSGLHVGFLILLIELALFRANKIVRFSVTTALLVAYAILADFSPSVIRAVIMATVAGASVFVGGRRDILSSLTCAFSLILAVRPIYLFEAGFIFSFGAIFGIAMFGNTISRAMTNRVNRKISESVGTAVSVHAGILPAQTYFFGSIRPLSILVNIVVLPYFGIAFVVMLLCLPFAAIPGLGGAVGWCKYLLMPIDYIAQGVAAVPIGISSHPSCAVFLCYPIMFCMSDYFMLPKSKLPLVLYSLVLCVILCIV